MYAEIVINHQLSKLHDSFSYEVPAGMQLEIGQIVLVPFGPVRHRGIVFELKQEVDPDLKGIKKILKISEKRPVLSKEQIELALWMSRKYSSALLDIVKMMLSFEVWKGKQKAAFSKEISLTFPVSELESKIAALSRAKKQQEALEKITKEETVETSFLKPLEKKGLIKIEKKRLWRSLSNKYKVQVENPIVLNQKQQEVLDTFESSDKKVALLHGVTSSGKTEIYLQAIQKVLEKGQQAIYLVPEIALTPQTIQRLVNRFPGKVAVWHHRLSAGEKADEWERICSGQASLVVGSRSALFTPVRNLGLIVMDEEHEGSYKQDRKPRYLARDVAEQMTKLTDCKLILGSATPSIESYYLAQSGEYQLLELPERIDHSNGLPAVEIVDLRDEFKKKNYSYFSDKLQEELKKVLTNKKQAILFLNRRGSASGLLCRDCGWRSSCPNCDISLTVHGPKLICHYCGFTENIQARCPECSSVAIKSVGVGTQKVEQELKKLFPAARVLRADSDTTAGKDSHADIYQKFKNHEVDILVGTQMIAKGWDLPNVDLVGIIIADIGLHMPDFRAGERVFSLITQVAGRAGRGENPGKVILQTYDPEHEAIQFGMKHDYQGFFENEIKLRKTFRYPPFSRVLTLRYVEQDYDKALQSVKEMRYSLEDRFAGLEILGPTPAYPPRMYGKYHFDILIKLQEGDDLLAILEKVPQVGWRIDLS